MALHNTKIDLSKDQREKVIELLNARLADAADLKSQCKQAHWNVKGMSFIALHELFDDIATAVEAHIDLIAERVTTLGGTAMGTVRLAAENSSLSEYPHEITDGQSHVDALSTALADFGKVTRKAIDESSDLGDQDTA
ncbi:MAG TPA: DNA starvation/stationary phase protection protein Dps, partial [Pyrinomonadaceae bacterium]|nr:DNA starvation/stationary phase protection protein Dps [Pyrinomonadaceae bacterium]